MAEREKAWWLDYFSPVYREVYEGPLANPRQTRREAAFLEIALGSLKPGPILDVGCGFGRHVRALRHRGFQVVGVDRFPHLLQRHARRGRRVVCGDMRRLGFSDGAFRGAYCIFNTFGYFGREENRRVLDEVARVLSPGGRFVLQIPNGPVMAEIARLFTPSHTVGPVLTVTEQYNHDPDRNTLQGSGIWEMGEVEQAWSLELQLYSSSEIVSELESSGLRVLEMYGDYDLEQASGDGFSEIVLVAEKPSE